MTTIIGIKVNNRIENAGSVQQILTNYGCVIRTRIGLHQEENGKCSLNGIILLEIIDDDAAISLANELCDIEEIQIEEMKF